MIIVSKMGDGDFTTIAEAIKYVNKTPAKPAEIYIKKGIYEEKLFIRAENLVLTGEDCNTTVIQYGDGAKKERPDGREYGTFNTAAVMLAGSHISVSNLTIKNTAGPGNIAGQALAAYIAADCSSFSNCAFLGWQDTIFLGDTITFPVSDLLFPEDFLDSEILLMHPQLRCYFQQCYIEGDVDFIFGHASAFFYDCEIHSKRLASEGASFITAANTPQGQDYGFVFFRCRLTCADPAAQVYLGRPWRDFAQTAFLECEMDAHIHPHGWHNWSRPEAEVTANYLEYRCTGPGAAADERTGFCKILDTSGTLTHFRISKIFAGEPTWLPSHTIDHKEILS